jgi:predicted acylesterase/phospholipase RssA
VQEDRVQFLFVHPMSVSGRVAPTQALRRVGIKPRKEQVRFTYSHSQSIRMLAEAHPTKERVAFVWDDAAHDDPELESGVRQLPFPELDKLAIPHDVVVARADFPHIDRLEELLRTGLVSGRYRVTHVDDWAARFLVVRNWLDGTGNGLSPEDAGRASLDDISQMLLQYSRSQPRPPRLAMVLSGGGAKCSYQVGVVAALEEKLAELRRDNPEQGLDIALVVGTSGGAINSLPVAMGITGTAEGRQAFRDTWCALDQREIVRPSLLVRANMGLWFALLQTALVIWIVRRFVPDPDKRGRTFAIAFTVLAAIEIAVGYLPGSPWGWLGTNHVLHHIWLWLSFGVRASAWSLFAIGVAALVLEAAKARRGQHIAIPKRLTRTTLLAGVLGLPLLQGVTMLAYEETLSGGDGMERTLSEKFPFLINQHLAHSKLRPLEMDERAGASQRLQSVSRQVLERNLLRRDLVITGSCLEQTSQELPSDLYFYAPANPNTERPPYGRRGVSLFERPNILLDVIMGSGSIFPVFPPRRIENIPRNGEQIELVDGGFAHNSPVEAAVLWGATHIVLIEAKPRKRSERGNFLRNVTSSFRHLHQQAQLLDARSRGKVILFSIAPEPPHICVLDFADNLVAASIERGYRDAGMDALPAARFRKELGEPVFSSVGPAE